MANRTLGTRQKLVFRGPDKGPGKPGIGGLHEKTAGSKRQQKRLAVRQLQKLLGMRQAADE